MRNHLTETALAGMLAIALIGAAPAWARHGYEHLALAAGHASPWPQANHAQAYQIGFSPRFGLNDVGSGLPRQHRTGVYRR